MRFCGGYSTTFSPKTMSQPTNPTSATTMNIRNGVSSRNESCMVSLSGSATVLDSSDSTSLIERHNSWPHGDAVRSSNSTLRISNENRSANVSAETICDFDGIAVVDREHYVVNSGVVLFMSDGSTHSIEAWL